MRLFNRNGKVNFVDENNVFLGYDMESSCCEHFGWYLNKEPMRIEPEKTEVNDGNINISEFNHYFQKFTFDTEFFQDLSKEDGYDEDSLVVFKIHYINEEGEEIGKTFIHLYNLHNGYYGHGFEFYKEVKIKEGVL